MGGVWELDLPHNQQSVLLAFADHADHEGHNVFPSHKLVAWKCGYGKAAVRRIVHKLLKSEILVLENTGSGGTGKPNSYSIHLDKGIKKLPFVSDHDWGSKRPPDWGSKRPPVTNATGDHFDDGLGIISDGLGIAAKVPQPYNHHEPSNNHQPKSDQKALKVSTEEIYKAYPRKIAKLEALKAIQKALKSVPAQVLLDKTKEFAAAWNESEDLTYCPHPATWFNGQRFNDDPSTWIRNGHRSPSVLALRGLDKIDGSRYNALPDDERWPARQEDIRRVAAGQEPIYGADL